jgi:hypothetical protein
MKISELCKMIEDSIHNGKYPLEDQQQKHLADYVEVINKSDSDDLKSKDIKIQVRIQNVYTVNNYVSNIEHLPGVIEMDVLDSFKMLCRRVARIQSTQATSEHGKNYFDNITISTERLHNSINSTTKSDKQKME